MYWLIRIGRVLPVLAWLALGALASAANVSDFAVYNYLDSNNSVVLPGRLHVPAEYATDPNEKRPLILFLHGSGESGTNNLSQINGNIDNLLTGAKARDAFLYAPQTNFGWFHPTVFSWVMDMIDLAIEERNVDPARIYVTGLSMGGGGTWNFLNQYPDRVAAAVPICGSPPTDSFSPANVIDEPIWAFHGRFDSSVHVSVTRNVIGEFLAEAGQSPPTYLPPNTFAPHMHFSYPPLNLHYTDMRGGHGIWPEVYNNFTINNQNLYDWMFAQRQVPEPSVLVLVFFAACYPVRQLKRASGPAL